MVFSVGSETTLFMAGIVEGRSVFERLEHRTFWRRIQAGGYNGPLNAFLAEAADRVREDFHGPVTDASVPLETVEWSRFDFVSVDLYRGAELTDRFTEVLERPASNSMIGWPSRCGPGLWQPGRSSLSGEPAVY